MTGRQPRWAVGVRCRRLDDPVALGLIDARRRHFDQEVGLTELVDTTEQRRTQLLIEIIVLEEVIRLHERDVVQ